VLLNILLIVVIIPYLSQADTRCGTSWSDANVATNGACGNLCTDNSECDTADGYTCYANVAPTGCTSIKGAPPSSSGSSSSSTSGSTSGRTTQTVTLYDLEQFMGGTTLTQNWCDAINLALTRYGLNTIIRIIGFLTQIRHETAGMTVFHQPADNGGGCLHMTPSNWQAACQAVPEIASAFGARYSGCGDCSCIAAMAASTSSATTTDASTNIFSQPQVAALSAGWWFNAGAIAAFGWKGCTQELGYYCDQGLGAQGSSDCVHTGNWQLTCCIFWTVSEASGSGITQRNEYYADSVAYAQKAWGYSGSYDTAEEVTQSVHTTPAINAGIAIGCAVAIIALIVVIIVIYLKRKQRIESEVV